jgi:transcriptional regulator of met regulon
MVSTEFTQACPQHMCVPSQQIDLRTKSIPIKIYDYFHSNSAGRHLMREIPLATNTTCTCERPFFFWFVLVILH